jgi:hypothetical protein
MANVLQSESEAANSLRLSLEQFRAICLTRGVPFLQYGTQKYYKITELEKIRKTLESRSS